VFPNGIVTIDQPSHLITARADLCNRISTMIQQADAQLPTISPVFSSFNSSPPGAVWPALLLRVLAAQAVSRVTSSSSLGFRRTSSVHPAESNTAAQPS